jgi:hypothetical protein
MPVIAIGATRGRGCKSCLTASPPPLLSWSIDLSAADAMIDQLPADTRRDVRKKWTYAREQRALALGQEIASRQPDAVGVEKTWA